MTLIPKNSSISSEERIFDPAVGSGVFSMGALHCLVHILHKFDPHNIRWKEEQIKAVSYITDPMLLLPMKRQGLFN
ncbi:MAG: hypothetical protein ACK4TF_09060 [Thermodesulfovibrionales bacterium]